MSFFQGCLEFHCSMKYVSYESWIFLEALSDFRVGLFLHLRLSCFLGAHLSSWSRQPLALGTFRGRLLLLLQVGFVGKNENVLLDRASKAQVDALDLLKASWFLGDQEVTSGIPRLMPPQYQTWRRWWQTRCNRVRILPQQTRLGWRCFLCGTIENHAFLFRLWRVRQLDADKCGCSRTLDTCFQFWLEWGLDLYLWAHAVEGYRCLDLTPVCPPQIRLWKLLRSGHLAGADHSESQLHS